MKHKCYLEKYPIILVPGLFGSWGEGIFKNNNNLSFGPARDIYSPLLKFLMENGYRPNKNLFVSFYNWRLDNSISMKRYLIPMINKVKAITKMNKVVLICHSMGGLVARSYIQGNNYQNDVDTLIMLGTPNSGTSTSYLFWEGGEVPYENFNNNFLFKIFWNSYLWHLKQKYRKEELKLLQEYFPAIKQLLPTKLFYGPYIYSKNKYARRRYVNIENMKEQNYFLEKLNRNAYKLKYRVSNTHQIIGYGFPTDKYIHVENNVHTNIWIDGKPIKINETISGDGTVTVNSSELESINKYYINKDHSDLVKYSNDILKDILHLKYSKEVSKDEDIYISLLLENIEDINIRIGNNNILSKDIYKYGYISYIPLDNDAY